MMIPVGAANVRKSYGARGNGSADDFQAIMDALNAGRADTPYGVNRKIGRTVYLPRGRYVITQPIKVQQVRGMQLVGEPGAVIVYEGDPNVDGIIHMEGSLNRVQGIHIQGNAYCGVRIGKLTSGTWVSTQMEVIDCEFSGQFTHCISSDTRNSQGLPTANNEYHVVTRCVLRGYGQHGVKGAGFHVFGSQSHIHRISECRFLGDARGANEHGIWTEYGSYLGIHGCYFENNALDIHLSDFIIVNEIIGCRSKNSSQFLRMGFSNTGSTRPVIVESCKIDHGSHLGENNDFTVKNNSIWSGSPGPVEVRTCEISATNMNPTIRGSGTTNYNTIKLINNRFRGPVNYHVVPTLVATGNVATPNTRLCGAYDFGGDTRNRSAQSHGNMHFNHTTGRYEEIYLQRGPALAGLMNQHSTVYPNNFAGVVDFVDGGPQEIAVTFAYPEPDADYLPKACGVEIYSGDTTAIVKATVLEGKSATGFTIRLSSAPVGWSARVGWMIVRTA